MSACRACRATVVWAKTTSGKAMPVDPAPAEDGDGNVALSLINDQWFASVLGGAVLDGYADREMLHKAHFATCPNWGK